MFHKTVGILCVIFLTISGGFAQEEYHPTKSYAQEALIKDYDEVVRALLAVHPGLLTFQTFNEFRYKATIARAQIEEGMTEAEFYKILSKLVNEVRCGHTFILPSLNAVEFYKDKPINFPLVLQITENSATVESCFRSEDERYLNKKIDKINGYEWESVRDSLWDYIPADGFIETRKDYLLGHNFEFFYRIFYGMPEKFEITFEDTIGVLKPISYEEIARQKEQTPILELQEQKRGAVLTLNTFSESKEFKKVVKKAFKDLRKINPERLTIDLRANDGGSTENMIYVLAYLLNEPFTIFDTVKVKNKEMLASFFSNKKQQKHYLEQIVYDSIAEQYYWNDKHNLAAHKPRKNNYQGPIRVLVGGGTFSSSVHFVACLLNEKTIEIVGEETGGFADHNNGGVIPKIVLPSTHLRLAVPLFQGRYHTEFQVEYGRGIFPDRQLNTAASKD